jgi:GNAT superfamily N-acetyltransferase
VEWLGHVAVTNDHKAAAFYGLIPCHFNIKNETFLAAQAVDAMTHPLHQRKGLFTQLVETTHDLARQEGVQFVFGFPNKNSYPGLFKLGWKFLPRSMQYFLLEASALPFAKLFLRIPLLNKIYRLYENKIVADFNFKNFEENPFSENGVVRDKTFLKYKSENSRTFCKKWPRVNAWLRNDGNLKVGLIRIDRGASPQHVVDHLIQTGKILGCRWIILMTSFNTTLYDLLITVRTSKDGFPIGFYNLTNRSFDFSELKFEYCDIDIF